jgi:hypothetical protein
MDELLVNVQGVFVKIGRRVKEGPRDGYLRFAAELSGRTRRELEQTVDK